MKEVVKTPELVCLRRCAQGKRGEGEGSDATWLRVIVTAYYIMGKGETMGIIPARHSLSLSLTRGHALAAYSYS